MASSGDRRAIGTGGWNLWRGVIGVFYLAAAVFNTIYTLPRTDQLEGFAEGAWFGVLADFMRDVFMPNGEMFMGMVIAFEVIVGLAILGRGRWVDFGIGASMLWVAAILPFLAWPYLLTNIALLFLQGVVVLRRYDRPLWLITRRRTVEEPPARLRVSV